MPINFDDSLNDPYHLPDNVYYTEAYSHVIKLLKGSDQEKNMWNSKEDLFGQKNLCELKIDMLDVLSRLLLFIDAIGHQSILIMNDKELEI
uniref:DUF4371 domain-containing protein n=1 Tax=Strongyloides papillosus TaxID=174720 RepID=A0A0N5C481_STREA